MVNKHIVNEYLDNDKTLTLLQNNTKKLVRKDLLPKTITKEVLHKYKGNLAWVLGMNDLVVDVDPRNGGFEGFDKLKSHIKEHDPHLELEPTVYTAQGGFHIYLSIPTNYQGERYRKELKDYEGVEFITSGLRCLIAGCETEKGSYTWGDDLTGGFTQEIAPNSIMSLITRSDEPVTKPVTNYDKPTSKKVEGWLDTLDPSTDYNTWLNVGMALHNWDSENGCDLWVNWSKYGDNYEVGVCDDKWKSFKSDSENGVTIGTISHMAKEGRYDELTQRVDDYISKINKANQKEIELNIIPKIKSCGFNGTDLEKLCLSIKDKYKSFGSPIGIAHIRKLLVNNVQKLDDVVPAWCNKWLHVNSHDQFVNMDTRECYSYSSFNQVNGKFVPRGGGGHKPSASKFTADGGLIQQVSSITYLPTYNGAICQIDGKKLFNTFNPKSIPKEAAELTEGGKQYVEMLVNHINMIIGTKEDSKIFIEWLAHQVQHPGKKILWSPLIQGVQGIGKSFFGNILRQCLGDANVGVIGPKDIASDFNQWATGVCVNIIEELKISGKNRFEAANALKPLITEPIIPVHAKNVNLYNTYNTCNYIVFTNYKDAIPLEYGDRRWWIIFSKLESDSDLIKNFGKSTEDYFDELFEGLGKYSSEVRLWLLDHKISDEFMKIKKAPMTSHKRIMIATEESANDGYVEVRNVIDDGGDYYNKKIIASENLWLDMIMLHPDVSLNNRSKNMILKRLGYLNIRSRFRVDGELKSIWAKYDYSDDEIRESLSKASPNDGFLL